jgi:hypothetical protein
MESKDIYDRFDEDVIYGYICPYCGGKPELTDSIEIYGKSYGDIYLCRPCRAWVGTHKGSRKPLGRLANEELREWKKRAHFYFDRLWKSKRSKRKARSKGYKWLSEQLKTELNNTHIGMFDVELCKIVVKLCQPYFIRSGKIDE